MSDQDRMQEAFEDEYGDGTWDYLPYEREKDAFIKGWEAKLNERTE